MAGIYIHIPFCRQACHYCDFHFSTTLKLKGDLVAAINTEAILRKDYLKGESISTVYFGGGTPSLLTKEELASILNTLKSLHTIEEGAEITLEANPDDLTAEKLAELKMLGINRLSIGIQSFIEQDLRFMNRAHNAEQAANCVKLAQQAGFDNISIDLIYGTQTLDDLDWMENIEKAIALGVQHISAYALTVEPRTALSKMISTGKVAPANEEKAAVHFHKLVSMLNKAGFEHYEISNFALPGYRSQHNSSYWRGVQYLGLGPAAHSFNGKQRHSAIHNNPLYIKEIANGTLPLEEEGLSLSDRYNEYVMTTLRTIEGIDVDVLGEKFGLQLQAYCMQEALPFVKEGRLTFVGNNLTLTRDGKFFADGIASALFKIDE
jgi:oxygen-independent coproporphyrinogen-3 oxidase